MGPDSEASPPPLPGGCLAAPRDRRSGPSPQTRRRRRDATVAHMAVLHDATLRHDDTPEGQLGVISFHQEAVDFGTFGSKTDQLLQGQSAQMPPEEATPLSLASGARGPLGGHPARLGPPCGPAGAGVHGSGSPPRRLLAVGAPHGRV